MGFIATSFVFDEIPGDLYNLYLATDGSPISREPGSSNVELRTKSIYRRSVPYFYGVTQTPVLSFSLSFFSPDEIDGESVRLIQRWLFGSRVYKKLQIIQEDMDTVYFNCFLTQPQMIKVGGVVVGFDATVICDSPFAWEFEETLTKSYSSPNVEDSFIFNNTGDNQAYLYPHLSVTFNSSGGDLTITNSDDGDREFILDNLTPGEVLTINNDLKILTSSTGLRRLSKFNKKWFRLVQGVNALDVVGNVETLVFTYSFPRKIGG